MIIASGNITFSKYDNICYANSDRVIDFENAKMTFFLIGMKSGKHFTLVFDNPFDKFEFYGDLFAAFERTNFYKSLKFGFVKIIKITINDPYY